MFFYFPEKFLKFTEISEALSNRVFYCLVDFAVLTLPCIPIRTISLNENFNLHCHLVRQKRVIASLCGRFNARFECLRSRESANYAGKMRLIYRADITSWITSDITTSSISFIRL